MAGDLVKIDIGVAYRGWIGDAAWTYSLGAPSPQNRKLMDAGKESLRRGIDALRPGKRLVDWAKAVQTCVESDFGFHLVRGLGGHGYGRKLHDAPFISNSVPAHRSEWPDSELPCAAGMLLAVEPMIAIGTGRTKTAKGQWPVLTGDGSYSSHHEHDVLITENGPRVLTEGLDELPDELPA